MYCFVCSLHPTMQPRPWPFRWCFTIRFRHFDLSSFLGKLLTYIRVVAKQAGSAFIASYSSRWHTAVSIGFSCASGCPSSRAFCEPCSPSDRNEGIGNLSLLTSWQQTSYLFRHFCMSSVDFILRLVIGQWYATMCVILINVKLKVKYRHRPI